MANIEKSASNSFSFSLAPSSTPSRGVCSADSTPTHHICPSPNSENKKVNDNDGLVVKPASIQHILPSSN